MLYRYLLLVICTLLVTGCASRVNTISGETAYRPDVFDMLRAKVGVCGNIFTDEQVSRYAGTESYQSPEERKEKKAEVIMDWKEDVSDAYLKTKDKQFVVSTYAAFQGGSNGRLYFSEGTLSNNHVEYEYALPSKILFNVERSEDTSYLSPYYAINRHAEKKWNGQIDSDKVVRKLKEYVRVRYGNNSAADQNTYVINEVMRGPDRLVRAKFGGFSTGYRDPKYLLGINLEIPSWMGNKQSVIKKNENGAIFLDSKMFDFYSHYNAYPDIHYTRVRIDYIYTVDRCEGTDLHGTVTEISINSIPYNSLVTTNKIASFRL